MEYDALSADAAVLGVQKDGEKKRGMLKSLCAVLDRLDTVDW
jgi:hypothetical protein